MNSSWQTCSVPVPFSGPPVLLWVRIAYLMLPQQQEQQMLQVATTAAVCRLPQTMAICLSAPHRFVRLFYAPPGSRGQLSSSNSSSSSSFDSVGSPTLSLLLLAVTTLHASCNAFIISGTRHSGRDFLLLHAAGSHKGTAYACGINLVLTQWGW